MAMEPPKKCGLPNPLAKAGWLSMLLFCYVKIIFDNVKRHTLSTEYIFHTPPSEETAGLGIKLAREWDIEVEKHKAGRPASIGRALTKAFGWQYSLSGVFVLLQVMCAIGQPVLLKYLIPYFSEETEVSQQTALLLSTGVAVCCLVQAILPQHLKFFFSRSGKRWKGAISDLIYKKVLVLPQSTLSDVTTGHVLDLITLDANCIDQLASFIHWVWLGPVLVVVCLVVLYQELGPCVYSGLAVLILLVPAQVGIGWGLTSYWRKNIAQVDERLSIMNEIISSVRVIKMYCWEKAFGQRVDAIRKRELDYLWNTNAFVSVMLEIGNFNKRLITAVVITVYVATNNTISAAKVFPMLLFFDILGQFVLSQLTRGFMAWLHAAVSFKRIEDFLLLPELNDTGNDERRYTHTVPDLTKNESQTEPLIVVSNITAKWGELKKSEQQKRSQDQKDERSLLENNETGKDYSTFDTPKDSVPFANLPQGSTTVPTIDNISFKLTGNKLVAVIGETGSGKTSLLMSLLGELRPSSGSIKIEGSVSYSAQEPWVFPSTIRQNILFGRTYDAKRYANVIEAAALTKDLSLLSHGDLSRVGEKGITVSGGQKARVSLARALYADTDIVLLDDPLSAVDHNVGRHIYDNFVNGLLKDKLTVLVTHQSHYLKGLDTILVLKKGKVSAVGSYQQLLDAGHNFGRFNSSSGKEETLSHPVKEILSSKEIPDNDHLIKKISEEVPESVKEEDRNIGKISWRLYLEYLTSGANICIVLLIVLLFVTSQATYNASDWWLSEWSDMESAKETNSTNRWMAPLSLPFDTYKSVAIYLGITAGSFVFGLGRFWSAYRLFINASRELHNRMFNSVIRAPVRFYDVNSKGRILNRFSGDIVGVDIYVPDRMIEFTQFLLLVLGNLLVIFIFNPWTIIPVLPVSVALGFIRVQYLKCRRDLNRVETETQGPLLTHFTVTMEGLQTIRAFKSEEKCIQDFHEQNDTYVGAWFTNLCLEIWFLLWTNLMVTFFNVATIYIITLLAQDMYPGKAGLTLLYALSMMVSVEATTRISADMEVKMVHTERVIAYTKLEPEADMTSDNPPPKDWPRQGGIVFDRVSFAYHDKGPLVLKNLDLNILPGSKIGIVGRTGAGKSSIVQALCRICEPYGQIRIDGTAINDIGLHELRSKLTVIPQDPILFKGTVRRNMDPFDTYTDELLWKALQEVQLHPLVSGLVGGLDGEVAEGGGNLSIGQKQLFCLGRAILRQNKILIIDEATANVDKTTDELIQSSIKRLFPSCTVLTVAHRINTVLDSDKILVMNEGRAVEFDTPYNLLQNQNSQFSKMVAAVDSF